MEFLPNEVTQQEDAIEKYFCIPLSKKKPEKMNDELVGYFMSFATSTEQNVDIEKGRKAIWQLQALEKRMDLALNYTADNRVKLFVVMMCDGVIGQIMMYAYYMQYLCKINNIKHITWEDFAMKFFPNGFFSLEDLKSVWDGQKVSKTTSDGKVNNMGSDNLLDYATASKSIMF